MRNLKGIFSALLVSFNEDGSINEKGLREIIRYNIDKMKIDGLYVVEPAYGMRSASRSGRAWGI